MAPLSNDFGSVEDQELLSTIPVWDYREYVRWCSACQDARLCLEMAVGGDSLYIQDRQGHSTDTCLGAYALR